MQYICKKMSVPSEIGMEIEKCKDSLLGLTIILDEMEKKLD